MLARGKNRRVREQCSRRGKWRFEKGEGSKNLTQTLLLPHPIFILCLSLILFIDSNYAIYSEENGLN